MHWLQEALEDAGFETRSYSGRGMYGKYCLGVTTDNPIEVAAQAVARAVENVQMDHPKANLGIEARRIADEVGDASTDSMGLDVIVYWPGVPYEGDDEDDE